MRKVHPDPVLPYVFEADWTAHQKIGGGATANDPLSSCYWPASLPLARVLARSHSLLTNATVLEIGAGTGLCSMASAAAGAAYVLATDVDRISLSLVSAAAEEQKLDAVATSTFDVLDSAMPLPEANVLILSDPFVTERLARAHARRVAEACAKNFRLVCVVDPNRSSRNSFLEELSLCGVTHEGFQPFNELGSQLTQSDTIPGGGSGLHSRTATECEPISHMERMAASGTVIKLLSTDEGAALYFEI